MAYYRHLEGIYGPDTEEYLEIFQEYDFSCDDIGCDFFCPECRYMLNCETYREVKESWESFYI